MRTLATAFSFHLSGGAGADSQQPFACGPYVGGYGIAAQFTSAGDLEEFINPGREQALHRKSGSELPIVSCQMCLLAFKYLKR
jgi:hypothetical protein